MKRHKHLFEQIASFENLLRAARKAQRGKRFRPATAAFNHRLESEVLRLQDELRGGTYQPGAYTEFYINDPKRRLISAAPYRDRVVHHALCQVIEPLFERTFIHDSYACRPCSVGFQPAILPGTAGAAARAAGWKPTLRAVKGTHAAVDRLTRFMQGNDYALKCDLRRYFPSVDNNGFRCALSRPDPSPGGRGSYRVGGRVRVLPNRLGRSLALPCRSPAHHGERERARGVPSSLSPGCGRGTPRVPTQPNTQLPGGGW